MIGSPCGSLLVPLFVLDLPRPVMPVHQRLLPWALSDERSEIAAVFGQRLWRCLVTLQQA